MTDSEKRAFMRMFSWKKDGVPMRKFPSLDFSGIEGKLQEPNEDTMGFVVVRTKWSNADCKTRICYEGELKLKSEQTRTFKHEMVLRYNEQL